MKTTNNTDATHPIAKLLLGNRYLLGLGLVLALAAGGSALQSLPRLEDPIITHRNPLILTLFPGASAERVEANVTKPLEEALQEIDSIKTLESTSSAGVSVLALELSDAISEDSNDEVFTEIRDRMRQAAGRFPEGVLPPQFDDKRNAIAFSIIVSLSPSVGGEENMGLVGRYAEDLAERLRQIGSTELVRVYGKPEEEVRVDLRSVNWTSLGWSLPRLADLILRSDATQPAGVVRGEQIDLLLEVEGEFRSLDRIRQIPLSQTAESGTLVLQDIAEVSRGFADPASEISLTGGTRSVLVAARVQSNARLDLWTQDAQAVVQAFAAEAGEGLQVDTVFTQDDYTSSRPGELGLKLLLGAAVVFLVVFFTMGWRTALIVGMALPLSAAITLFLTAMTGGALNQMSIFGMIIALGLLIDNAIVITDEVNHGLRKGLTPLSAGFGLLATWVWGFPLSFNTMIGSLGLIGLAFNSSIVVLAAIRANPAAAAGDIDALIEACLGCGRHLVSTTLTTIGSFLPLLIFIGGQFWPPLAVVLAGGAGGSTLLALFFTPVAYRCLTRLQRKRAPRTDERDVAVSPVGVVAG